MPAKNQILQGGFYMEWGINKEGYRKRGERDMALLRLAAMRKNDFSKTWVGRQRLQKEIQEYRKKYM